MGTEPREDGALAALRGALAAGSDAEESLRLAFQRDPEFALNLFCVVIGRRFGDGCDIRDVTALTARLRAERPGFPALEAEQVIRWVLGEDRLGQIDWSAQNYTEVCVAVLVRLLDDWRPSEAELDQLFRLTWEQSAGARAMVSDIAPSLARASGEPLGENWSPDDAADLESLHLVTLGFQAVNRGRYQDALTALNRAVALTANSFWAAIGLAEAYAGLAWWDEAVAEYRRAVSLDSSSAVAWHGLASALGRRGRHGEALDGYNRAIECDPRHSATFAGRGAVHEALGNAELALADYNRAVELDGGNRWAIERRTDLCRRIGQAGE